MLRSNLWLFAKSFSVSAFIGISYIVALEVIQWLLGYSTGMAHASAAFLLYLSGIFVNYSMQKNLVFRSGNDPVVRFFAYNIANAFLVSAVSGLIFAHAGMQQLFGPLIESASTAIALLLISPITFIVFKRLFHTPDEEGISVD